ncbi:MAG TPA: EFR1 family ferrodoxin [Spirochaetota bacterium]|nr:EFR1 family ferrodoxin [Spirochaetota bacterium]
MTVIWYFSSTGNSLHAARSIAEKTGAGAPRPMRCGESEIDLTDADRVGFVFPVYLHGVPSIVESFISRIQFRNDAYVFAVVTHNGEPGGTLRKLHALLRRKGRALSAGYDIKMPGNSVILADLTSDEGEQSRRVINADAEIQEIIRKVNEREVMPVPPRDSAKGFFLAKILGFVTMIYRVHARFWTNDACRKCGMCVRVCPVGNISMDNGVIRWKGKCLNCLACYHWCPEHAVELDHYTAKRRRYHHPRVSYPDMI